MKTPVKIGEEILTLVAGSQTSLPDISNLNEDGAFPYLTNDGNLRDNCIGSDGPFLNDSWPIYYYGLSNSGYFRYEAFLDTSPLDGWRAARCTFYNSEIVSTVPCDNPITNQSQIAFYKDSSEYDINSGSVTGTAAYISAHDILSPWGLDVGVNYLGINNFGIYTGEVMSILDDSIGSGPGFSIFGYLDEFNIYQQKKFKSYSDLFPEQLSFFTALPVDNAFNCITINQSNIKEYTTFEFTNMGDPDICVTEGILFDEGFINTDFEYAGIFTDGFNFYFDFTYDGVTGDPQSPYLIRVNQDFTEYTLIFVSTEDPAIAAIINDFISGGTEITFGWSFADNQIMMVPASEPVFYALGGSPTPTPDPIEAWIGAPPYIPIQNLSCQNYCLPFYKKG
jgi:hypothetical protein